MSATARLLLISVLLAFLMGSESMAQSGKQAHFAAAMRHREMVENSFGDDGVAMVQLCDCCQEVEDELLTAESARIATVAIASMARALRAVCTALFH